MTNAPSRTRRTAEISEIAETGEMADASPSAYLDSAPTSRDPIDELWPCNATPAALLDRVRDRWGTPSALLRSGELVLTWEVMAALVDLDVVTFDAVIDDAHPDDRARLMELVTFAQRHDDIVACVSIDRVEAFLAVMELIVDAAPRLPWESSRRVASAPRIVARAG